jgi:hypothetical protein
MSTIIALEGDEAPTFGVLSLVDKTHTSATELFDDAVVRYGLANPGRGSRCARPY